MQGAYNCTGEAYIFTHMWGLFGMFRQYSKHQNHNLAMHKWYNPPGQLD